MDIFNIAKSNTKTTKSAKASKPEILLDEKQYEGVSILIDSIERLRQQKKNIETDLKMKENTANEIFKSEWCNLYEKTGVRPESLIFTGEKSSSKLMFIGTDKYTKITNPEEVKELYGEDIIEENVTYSFDSELLMKHYDTIVNLFANCSDIPAEDKVNLIKADQSFTIKKGTIDRLHTIKGAIKNMVEVFGIVFQTKSVS